MFRSLDRTNPASETNQNPKIAIFGDASKTGMGVAAYAVAKINDNQLRPQLIYSKSSLMPKNLRDKAKLEDALTIARAELIALTMAVTMGNYIQNALPDVTSANTVYFTDLGRTQSRKSSGHKR